MLDMKTMDYTASYEIAGREIARQKMQDITLGHCIVCLLHTTLKQLLTMTPSLVETYKCKNSMQATSSSHGRHVLLLFKDEVHIVFSNYRRSRICVCS